MRLHTADTWSVRRLFKKINKMTMYVMSPFKFFSSQYSFSLCFRHTFTKAQWFVALRVEFFSFQERENLSLIAKIASLQGEVLH